MPSTRADTPRLGTVTRTGVPDFGLLAGEVVVVVADGPGSVAVFVGVRLAVADGLTDGVG
jgi:hypothetical protein